MCTRTAAMDEQEELLRKIKALSDSVRRKAQALKLGLSERDKYLEETFKPIVDPLKKLNEKIQSKNEIESIKNEVTTTGSPEDDTTETYTESDKSIQESEDSQDAEEEKDEDTSLTTSPTNVSILSEDIAEKGPLTRKYLMKMLHNAPKSNRYHVFGARLEKDGIHIGNSRIVIDNLDHITIKDQTFKGTKGLFELIFSVHPLKYTKADLNVFKQICILTSLHRKAYSANTPIHRSKSMKYKRIISKLFTSIRGKKRGKGMAMKSVNDTNVIYYNDVNKLVDRMRLLYESMQAGHTGLDNEMVALTEELKRSGYVIS